MKTLGVIGGMGPAATALFYRLFLDACAAGKDQDYPDTIILSLPSIPERSAYILDNSRENPLPLLKEALLAYQKKRKRRITLEMVLLGGINTGPSDAEALADFAAGLGAVINLIPWNPVEDLSFEGRPLRPPTRRECEDFAAALKSRSLNVTRRLEKGRGISGACGQLGGSSFG